MASETLPAYVVERMKVWDEIAGSQMSVMGGQDIKVTLKNGNVIDAIATITTPMEICKKISNSLAKSVVIAKVNDKLWDLNRPLEGDCKLEFLDFESKEGSHVFWHSSAHILGQAIELEFKDAQLTIGPPLDEGGFYYDVYLPNNGVITPADYDRIQKRVNDIIKQKQNFTRLVLTKEEALRMFKGNPFKEEIITKRIGDGDVTSAYRCGPLIDLCRGPHVQNTGRVTAMIITRSSASNWNADVTKARLQRVYGVSFPSKALLDEHLAFLKAAEERDHRRIGQQQELFFFHPLSPGSCFFLPHGTRLYNKLQSYIRDQYWKRGYSEVVSPNVYNVDLWKQSGHYANYRENMFSFQCENQEFAMKPMNCPGHCLMFGHRLRSYRELPIRFADFGVLHRNEVSGALSGLTRVRRFQQDDAHIFCRKDQIAEEVMGVLDMLQEVYGHFGFKFNLNLSTRPEKFLGDISLWDEAEAQLKLCLDGFCAKFGHTWELNPGDGAFYGPKIDIQLTDALKRKHQCGTCQLDFQLPIRFGLSYRNKESTESASADGTEQKGDGDAAPVDSSAPKDKKKKDGKGLDKESKEARAAAHRAAYEKKKAEEAAAAAAAASSGTPATTDSNNASKPSESVSVEKAAEPEKEKKSAPEPVVNEEASLLSSATTEGCCGQSSSGQKEYEWKEEPLQPGYERPVMIHRAILGSVERMIAVLIEHTGGKWPLWLNPRQICVVPIAETFIDYAREVANIFHNNGFYVDVADSNHQFKRKVAESLAAGYSYLLIVGAKEQSDRLVNVRARGDIKQTPLSIDECVKQFKEQVANFQ